MADYVLSYSKLQKLYRCLQELSAQMESGSSIEEREWDWLDMS